MKRGEIFNFVQSLKIPTSKFDLSHGGLVTSNMGYLVPVDIWEVLPGDLWSMKLNALTKFAPLLAPIYHRIDVSYHFFFVPQRLLTSHYEDFHTGGKDGLAQPVLPTFDPGMLTFDKGSLPGYLTHCFVEPNVDAISALPFFGYQFIWSEFFRDQNLTDPIDLPVDAEGKILDDDIVEELTTLRKRCWEKDYLTSALPFAQRGPEVIASLAGAAPVSGFKVPDYADGMIPVEYSMQMPSAKYPIFGENVNLEIVGTQQSMASVGGLGIETEITDTKGDSFIGELSAMADMRQATATADLSSVSAFSINDLRNLEKTQEVLESLARSGGRYVEYLHGSWGVISPDARQNRPELIGYIQSPVQVSELLQTSPSQEDGTSDPLSGVGEQYGQAISISSGKRLRKYCTEHGYIYCLMSVRPRTSYMNQLHKMWMRSDRFDFALPNLGHLGEQEVKNYEAVCNHNDPEGTFGYQSRYAEYKYLPDFVAGEFASDKAGLNFWHLARKLPADVALNQDFVECSPSDRIFAVEGENSHKLRTDIWFDLRVFRKLPRFGTPHW